MHLLQIVAWTSDMALQMPNHEVPNSNTTASHEPETRDVVFPKTAFWSLVSAKWHEAGNWGFAKYYGVFGEKERSISIVLAFGISN